MLGKFFKKARETVSGISDAVRGVEHVDWITHAFPYSLEMLMDVDEARDLSRPRPPAGLDPAAVQYADAWYGIWARVRDGHVAPVQAVEAGDVAGAQQALAQWEAQLEQADVEQARLGEFRGNRHLVLANSDIRTTLGAVVEEVREYIGLRISGRDAMEHATGAITRVVSIHTSMNNALLGFYQDPSGAAARAAENAAFAPIEAMRQVNPAAPELQPVLGVSLHDWVAASAKMHAGVPGDEIARILGVERPQWDQASAEWIQRVQMFPMTVGMEYANLMSRPHPKFDAAGSAGGAPSNAARLLRPGPEATESGARPPQAVVKVTTESIARPGSFSRPPSPASSRTMQMASTRAPARSSSSIEAAAVPPVAKTSSMTRTRWPGTTVSGRTSIRAVPYSNA
mgnify:CR=1 FL=1